MISRDGIRIFGSLTCSPDVFSRGIMICGNCFYGI